MTDLNDVARRILIVEDELDEAELLEKKLKAEGFIVAVVHNGFAALSTADSFRPHVILVDLGLPGFDGLQLTEALRDLPGINDVWIFATTGRTDEVSKKRARAAGIDMFFAKPLDHSDLAEVLRLLTPRPPSFVPAPFV